MKGLNYSYNLFGGKISVLVYGMKKEDLVEVMKGFYQEALRLQKIFNLYDSESELSTLNAKREMKVCDELCLVIKKGLEFSKLTNGKYDISLGKKIFGRKKGKEIEVSCSYKNIIVKGNKITLAHDDVIIDLGSIAKGFITDRLGDYLKKRGIKEFIIDSRGDILVVGTFNHIIGIQHPRSEKETIGDIKIKNKGITTSGDYKQFSESYDRPHIINSSDSASITVVADTVEEADVYATVLFVLDSKERKKVMSKNKNVRAFVVSKGLKITTYNNFTELILK